MNERPSAPWGVRVNVARLRREMARRGLTGSDLATLAGISAATMSAAMRGRSISPRTLRRIVDALARRPPLPGADDLVDAA